MDIGISPRTTCTQTVYWSGDFMGTVSTVQSTRIFDKTSSPNNSVASESGTISVPW